MQIPILFFLLFQFICWTNTKLDKDELILSETHDEVIIDALQFFSKQTET